jgi:hypothetical protein
MERGLRAAWRNGIETPPCHTADSAFIVGLAAKIEAARYKRRDLRDQARCNESDGHPARAWRLTRDARDACQQEIGFGSERIFVKNYVRTFKFIAS